MPPARKRSTAPTVEIARSGEMAALDDGAPFPSWVEVLIRNDNESPVMLRIEVDAGRPVLAAITVARRGPGTSVGSSVLRDAPVKSLIDVALAYLLERTYLVQIMREGSIDAFSRLVGAPFGYPDDPELMREVARRTSEAATTRRRYTITNRLLEEVAAIYKSDETGAPTVAVKNHFHTSHRNATRWVKEARERRLLPPYKEES